MFGKQANTDIRKTLNTEDLRAYQIAYYLGISPQQFSEWLAVPMNEDRKKRTLEAIEQAKKERK